MSSVANISVIVPTKNEANNICRFLASVPQEVELVVCDASSDDTRYLVKSLRPHRTVIVDAPGTIAEARQIGVEASSGEVLVFSDADVEFDPQYFARLSGHLHWDGIGGAKRSRTGFSAYYDSVVRSQGVFYRWFGIVGASGSNMVLRRRTYTALGGFRPGLQCNEDTELFLRGPRRGFWLRFDEQLVVWAFDHRRLRGGCSAKTAHSFVRNLLLYLTCCQPRLPRLLESDWGYWRASL